ncbi:NADPH-dependent assimilatory sulfite reductase hemoprotein subunit [Aeoliella mucimassa]|uniref:Sulfite reductase [ferredoxin] n=1 Tax=Aeoliella mucimassa TaxID=2527972 RepID=A0A518AGZ5_9BACT|nr:NADPH-dependent assimilatory sulfite reductase hemoprotein subunit [Aeoliella mucimassa]QDU53974.1 Sulfite reductase [ferredoxin] [Aeoliella mucimassa]
MSDKSKPKSTKPSPLDQLKAAKSKDSSDDEPKLSGAEGVKLNSNFLRGTIAEELADDSAGFSSDNGMLLKHHGSYQQDDRDRRAEAKKAGVPGGKYFSFMVRTAIPGGRITSDQFLEHLKLGQTLGDGTLRLTTRQGIQLHGVLKSNLKAAIRRINEVQLTTLAACGDVRRNLMCNPAPYKNDPVYDKLQELAEDLAAELKPNTTAYHEIWLTDSETGEKTNVAPASETKTKDTEPLYGKTYLPRKFKLGVALPGDNSADVYSQDVGFLAVCEDFDIVGYNVLVGGGFGVTPSASKTYAAIAMPMAFIPVSDTNTPAIDVAKAVLKVQRDFGNRSDRKTARLKYLVRNWGLEKFTKKVEEYLGHDLQAPRPMEVIDYNDALGWNEQGDGRWFYGLFIENGRIKDAGDVNLMTALTEICKTMAPPMRITPHQNLIFCDLSDDDRERLEGILVHHGVVLTDDISTTRRWSMACPALPMCGLAVTESERMLPTIMDEMERELTSLGLGDEVFTTRMTGCPNGCSRPYNADIGLVGKTKGKYTIFLGGRRQGDRLNWVFKDLVPEDEVVSTLLPVFRQFRDDRQTNETFGDFCHRLGKDALAT